MSRRMPDTVRAAFETELAAARTATTGVQRWTALERAHILSQPWAWPHTRAHAVMLALAWRDAAFRDLAQAGRRKLLARLRRGPVRDA